MRNAIYTIAARKNRKFKEIFELAFCVRNWEQTGFFRGEHVPDTKFK